MAKREFTIEEMRAEFKRREEGYRIMEQLRRKEIRETDTANVIRMFSGMLPHILKSLPKRNRSGLEDFYAALMKTRS